MDGLSEGVIRVDGDWRVADANPAAAELLGTDREELFDGDSPIVTVTERGATVPSATYESGTGRLVIEMAPEDDVHETVEAVSGDFPDTALLANRDRRRPVETEERFRSELDGRLTDRQRTALRATFHADYFESPRGSTAEEVAESLEIASPTFQHHIRAGLDELLSVYLDESR